MVTSYRHTVETAVLAIVLMQAPCHASAQSAPLSTKATAQPKTSSDAMVVTSTRTAVPDFTTDSPISSRSEQHIQLRSAPTLKNYACNSLGFGVYDIIDRQPPRWPERGKLNTFARTYDILSRTIGVPLTAHL